jgi:hypothetical protein
MIFTLPFLAGVYAITCTKYTCDFYNELEVGVCYKDMTDRILLKECPDTYSSCPPPDQWSGREHRCKEWNNVRRWGSETLEEYIEYETLPEGSFCDPDDIYQICNLDADLVCHCPKRSSCKCTLGASEGEHCSEDIPCSSGYVCNHEECVLKYSMDPGDVVTDKDACPVGSPIIQRLDEMICDLQTKTYGSLPKTCVEDSDCTGDDGITIKPCICGINIEGTSYCSLHEGDDDFITWKYAVRDDDWDVEVYYEFLVSYYPYIQGDLPECLPNVWKDFGEFFKGDPDIAKWIGLGVMSLLIII